MISRYKTISVESIRLFAAPAENRILAKLVWPLRHAKACYMTGNYFGTMSLCGIIAGIIAILLFEISDFTINGKVITGSEFEKLGQLGRVAILKTYNLIDDQLKNNFDLIRTKRRRYLHIYSQDHDELSGDVVEVFKATVTIVAKIIGQDVRDGKIVLNPALVRYLEKLRVD